MEEQSFVQDGVDRFNDAVRSLDAEFQRVQKQLRSRRRSFEKRITGGRRDFERRTRKQVKRLRTELRKNPVVKRAQSLQDDVSRQIEDSVDRLLGVLQIASKNDFERLDRKLSQLNRKLKELERARRGNGEVASL